MRRRIILRATPDIFHYAVKCDVLLLKSKLFGDLITMETLFTPQGGKFHI